MSYILILFILFSCAREEVPEIYYPTDTHTAYKEALGGLHLDTKNLGRQWLAAANTAFAAAVPVAIHFREERFFDATSPAVMVVEFTVPRGLRMSIATEVEFTGFFLDVFRVETRQDDKDYIPVASKPQTENRLEFSPNRQGRYLLRLQPELLEEGRILLTITGHASLAWPVKDSTKKDIISYFGLNRDAGERVHHGLDIKAPRGQAAVAAITATGRPGTNPRGGNVVRLSNTELDVMLYYAHLDTRLIERNTLVEPGDIVGTVGTTGNARGGTPHLHIGVYDGSWRTPADPWYFFVEPENKLNSLAGLPLENWGRIVKTSTLLPYVPAKSGLYRSPAKRDYQGDALDPGFTTSFDVQLPPASEKTEVAAGTPVKITGRRDQYFLIQTPGGQTGYLAAETVGSLPEKTVILDKPVYLSRHPSSATIARLDTDSEITELGEYQTLKLIRYANRLFWTKAL